MDNINWDQYPQEETLGSKIWRTIKHIVVYTIFFVLTMGVILLVTLLLGTILSRVM